MGKLEDIGVSKALSLMQDIGVPALLVIGFKEVHWNGQLSKQFPEKVPKSSHFDDSPDAPDLKVFLQNDCGTKTLNDAYELGKSRLGEDRWLVRYERINEDSKNEDATIYPVIWNALISIVDAGIMAVWLFGKGGHLVEASEKARALMRSSGEGLSCIEVAGLLPMKELGKDEYLDERSHPMQLVSKLVPCNALRIMLLEVEEDTRIFKTSVIVVSRNPPAVLVLMDEEEPDNLKTEYFRHKAVRLEKLMAERTEELRLSNEELQSFTYSVTHDLKTPLRAITGYSGLLMEAVGHSLTPDEFKMLDAIIKSSRRMSQLIDDLLVLSKVGQKKLSYTKLDMQGMLDRAINELSSSYKLHEYSIKVLSSLPEAYGDRDLVFEVLLNLLANALKYSSKSKSPEVIVGYRKEAGRLVFSIKDNGVGYDDTYAHRLFLPFQRLHSFDEFEGTGVGLAIVRRVIKMHGEKVWSSSKLGDGATFYFSLAMFSPQVG